MEIICSTKDRKERLENSISRIKSNLQIEIAQDLESFPIILTDDHKACDLYGDKNPIFKKLYREGFGTVKGNIHHEGQHYHLVVINITNLEKLNITDHELDGIASHELGHIFNMCPPREMPSFLKGNNRSEIESAKRKWQIDNEVYADHFSKVTSTDKGLLSSFTKFLRSDLRSNEEIFEIRKQKLESNEIFEGIRMEIKKINMPN